MTINNVREGGGGFIQTHRLVVREFLELFRGTKSRKGLECKLNNGILWIVLMLFISFPRVGFLHTLASFPV